MWILQWLPNWIFYALFFIGLAGFFVTHLLKFVPIPAIFMYKNPIQMVSLVLIVFGVYMSGAISNEEAWKAKVTEMQSKLAKIEVESAELNLKIAEDTATKTEATKEHGREVIKYIEREVVKYNDQCVIPKEFVKAINDAGERAK